MNISKPSRVLVSLTLLTSLLLVGCASQTNSTDALEFGHVHGIVDLGSGEMLLGAHKGIFSLNIAGKVSGPVGGNDFDAMGITGNSRVQYSSGHPGPSTPVEFGSPNLGIIRSIDSGMTWTSVAFPGVEDFHVLTTGSDDTLYGIGSSSSLLRKSFDGGTTWIDGPALEAVDLVSTASGLLFALTSTGLQLSQDKGSTFSPVMDAPVLYSIAAGQNDGLVGVDVNGILWRLQNTRWEKFGSVSGSVGALIEISAGVVLVDSRGIVLINGDKVEVLHSISTNH